MIGQTFGRWTVVEAAAPYRYKTRFLCRCECGTERVIRSSSLLAESSRSCGCARNESRNFRLCPDDVRKIRRLIDQRVPYAAIAERFGISKPAVTYIKTGRLWGWVA